MAAAIRLVMVPLLLALLVLAGPAWAAHPESEPADIEFESPLEVEGSDLEFEFLIPDEAFLVYAMHNASVFTPDQYPQNAVFSQHARAEAQDEVQALMEDQYEIAEVEIQGEPTVAVHRLDLGGDEPVYLSSDAR